MQQIALHVRSEPGRFRTDQRHILDRKITGVERGATRGSVRWPRA
jgi:hypothetical protein